MSRRSRRYYNARARYNVALDDYLPRAQERVHRDLLHELLPEVHKSVRGFNAEYLPRRYVPRVFVAPSPFPPARQPKVSKAVQGYGHLRVLRMRAPARVAFCVRRKQRREVLFAFQRAGFGGSAPKRHYVRGVDSQYRC